MTNTLYDVPTKDQKPLEIGKAVAIIDTTESLCIPNFVFVPRSMEKFSATGDLWAVVAGYQSDSEGNPTILCEAAYEGNPHELYFHCFVKWDGCSHLFPIETDGWHMCGGSSLNEFCEVVQYVWSLLYQCIDSATEDHPDSEGPSLLANIENYTVVPWPFKLPYENYDQLSPQIHE